MHPSLDIFKSFVNNICSKDDNLFHHKHFQTYCDYKLYIIYKVLKTIVMSSPFDLRANKQ